MTLVDTSAWVDWLRGTESPTALAVDALLGAGETPATCEPILFELVVGTTSPQERRTIQRLVTASRLLTVGAPGTWEAAAATYRTCRDGGETIRSMADCLIAAVAMREDVEILHRDTDYAALARHVPIRQRTS